MIFFTHIQMISYANLVQLKLNALQNLCLRKVLVQQFEPQVDVGRCKNELMVSENVNQRDVEISQMEQNINFECFWIVDS